MSRSERGFWAVFVALVVLFAFTGVRPRGDCGEYVLMASAFAIHASPDVRDADARWVLANEPRLERLMDRVSLGIAERAPVLLGSIHRSPAGEYYSFHFWLYSLLAALFLWPVQLLGGSPLHALVAVNAVVVVAASAYAASDSKGFPRFALPLGFLLSGTSFYAGWTGPEALTASAALVSTIAAMRRALGVSLLAAGVAASQNPGAAALGVQAISYFFALRRDPRLSPFPPALEARGAALLMGMGGFALLLAAPVFFWVTFGEPSLIAKHTTDSSLVGLARAFSFVFDLNQGMVVGVPGVLAGLAVAAVLAVTSSRTAVEKRRAVITVALALGTATLMMIPSLSTHNWNSGCAVFMRYAYWVAVPLLVAFVGLLGRLDKGQLTAVAAGAALLQVGVLELHGVKGESSGYTRHGPFATFVLRHFPAAYNPDPEIFRERTLGREARVDLYPVVVWPSLDAPEKVLVTGKATVVLPKLCGTAPVESLTLIATGPDDQYWNGPFRCQGARAP